MTSLPVAVDTATLWLWTGGWRTFDWPGLARRGAYQMVRAFAWALMLLPFLAAFTGRLVARGWLRAVWLLAAAASWTVAAAAEGWAAGGGREVPQTWT